MFMFREAFINSKKIKSIFEIFNDKTNTEEIQSKQIRRMNSVILNWIITYFMFKDVLKFCGVSNDKMSFDEFK